MINFYRIVYNVIDQEDNDYVGCVGYITDGCCQQFTRFCIPYIDGKCVMKKIRIPNEHFRACVKSTKTPEYAIYKNPF